jgi:uncharacterized membrane protein YedE/YeeE
MTARRAFAALAAGLLFGAGLVIAGMTRPEKVIGFLDVFGDWDPSLAFVMAGAIGVHAVVFRVIAKRPSPLFASGWSIPTRRDVDRRLVAGAFVFGIGWGLAGICPGPGVVSLATFAPSALVFLAAMVVAMAITDRVEAWMRSKRDVAAGAPSP